jgi:2'-5' RNA ligase
MPDGPTAIIVPVPAAETAVSQFRDLYDPSARQAMPAHITVLYPCLREAQLTDRILTDLCALFAAQPPFDIAFSECGRFDGGVLYLRPQPAEPFRALTDAVVAAVPGVQPYGGMFDDVVPHLTVAVAAGDDTLAEIQTHLTCQLPITATVTAAWLFAPRGHRWIPHVCLPFADA